MQFDANGNLNAGIHDYEIDRFFEDFVNGFPTSQTRAIIFDSLISALRIMHSTCCPNELWIDGSYATQKVNPNDVDIVAFFDYDIIENHSDGMNQIRAISLIDFYISHSISDKNRGHFSVGDFATITNQRNYWRGQFGFDRDDQPKGIIRLNTQTLGEYIERRGF